MTEKIISKKLHLENVKLYVFDFHAYDKVIRGNATLLADKKYDDKDPNSKSFAINASITIFNDGLEKNERIKEIFNNAFGKQFVVFSGFGKFTNVNKQDGTLGVGLELIVDPMENKPVLASEFYKKEEGQ